MGCSEPRPDTRHRPGQRDPLLGTWLDGHYLIEERIATGGFGAVYRARTQAGARLALKVLHPGLTTDANAVARFEREGATLTRLHDPHTVATLAVGAAGDGTRYIAMELLAGESLHARLARERALPWQTAAAIAQAVCSSLAEAHALGLIHRDLKPDNICVERRGGLEQVKVIDFGIARFAPGSAIDDGQDLTSAGHMVGTYDYMAPEQLLGGACDAASDLYALGVVLYEMLTGQRPFARAATPAALVTAMVTQTPQPPSVLAAIPPALDRIVMRCLEREPTLRLSSAAELAAALERLLAHPPSARDEITAVQPACPRALRAAASRAASSRASSRASNDSWPPPPGPAARGSVRSLGDPEAALDAGSTLLGMAVVTERRSRPRITAIPRLAAVLRAVPELPLAPSAEAMLAPSIPRIPAVPFPRLATGSRPALPAPASRAAVLIGAALVAGVASFLLAMLL